MRLNLPYVNTLCRNAKQAMLRTQIIFTASFGLILSENDSFYNILHHYIYIQQPTSLQMFRGIFLPKMLEKKIVVCCFWKVLLEEVLKQAILDCMFFYRFNLAAISQWPSPWSLTDSKHSRVLSIPWPDTTEVAQSCSSCRASMCLHALMSRATTRTPHHPQINKKRPHKTRELHADEHFVLL